MSVLSLPDPLQQALQQARRVVAFTGAGISAESGIPTFREAQTGLWARYTPQELATPEAFARHPHRVWEWYTWRRELIAQARPNPAHRALAALESHLPEMVVITQNIDGLHQAAGSQRVIELHGNIWRAKCTAQGHRWQIQDLPQTPSPPPRCPRCGSLLRPDVVWFGEPLPPAAFQAAIQAAQHCQALFSIGTSALVQPAAHLPLLARQAGAVVIEINPHPTPLTPYVHHHLALPAGRALPELIRTVWGVTL